MSLLLLVGLIALLVVVKTASPPDTQASGFKDAHSSPLASEPPNRDTSANPRSRSSRSEQATWAKLENEQKAFSEKFSGWQSSPGMARGFWHGSAPVMFWMQTLSSSDTTKLDKAIEVFEFAAEVEPGKFFDGKGEVRSVLSFLEREGFGMNTMMLNAYQIMLDSRNNLNAALKNPEFTTGDLGKAKELMNNPTYHGDSDDAVVLKDALPVLKVFVPRMASEDPKVSESAKKVVNLFTYNLFPDEDIQWWNESLEEQTKPK